MGYYKGSGLRFKATYEDIEGNKVDPSEPKIKITDSKGAIKVEIAPNYESKGVYFYDYTIPPETKAGVWEVEWTGNVEDMMAIERKKFYVRE